MFTFKHTVVAALVLGGLGNGAVMAQASSAEQWVPGRLLVKPKSGVADAEFDKVLKGHGAKSVGKIGAIGVHIVQLPANASEKAIAALLAKNPRIKFAERDLLLKAEGTANDPYYGSAWHLSQIGVTTAWDSSSGQNIKVAVLDTGVDSSHPDLAGQVLSGWNFYDNNSNTSDDYGHGTKVAGTIAALTNNALGVSSVAWGAKIIPIRIANSSGTGSSSAMASGITWAADQGAKVANLSYMAAGSSTIQSAAQYLKNKGGLLVVSTGNYGTMTTAAASDTLISVSATGTDGNFASWSSYGNDVDVSAPGVSIPTTTVGGGYSSVSGTSFSSPITAAVISLMAQANPSLSPNQLQSALFSTTTDLGTTGWDIYYGWGRVNAAAAVLAAKSMVAADAVPPSVSLTAPSSGSTVSGIVDINVAATDNVGVTKVDLKVNGALVASDTVSPYAFSLDTTTLSDGTASIVAYAYDAAGNYGSGSVSVTVANAAPKSADLVAPVATVSNPSNNAKVSGIVAISVKATDNVAVSSTKLYIDGKQVASASSGTLSYNWNTKKASSGNHTISVEALDAAGNKGASAITVSK